MSVLFGSVVGACSKHPFYLHLLLNVSPNRGGQRRAGAVESCTAKGCLRGTCRGVQGKAVMGIRYQTHSPPAPPTKPRGRGQLPVVKVGRCRVTGQAVGVGGRGSLPGAMSRPIEHTKKGGKRGQMPPGRKIFLVFLFAPQVNRGAKCKVAGRYLAKRG